MSELTKREIQALRKGSLEVGLLTQATAIALFWRFHDAKGRPLMEFDTPFDARRIDRQSLSLPSKEQVNEKLLINIIGVDRATGLIKALRLISLPLRLSDAFLCAVADQLGAPERQAEADRTLLRWQQTPIDALSQQIRFEAAGS